MRKFSFVERLIAVCCILAIMLSFPWTPVSAAAETGVQVTASTNASVKQGNSAYTYVYIDSLESLSTLEITVHFDPSVVQLTGSYNQVAAMLYDSASTESTLQYTYIFDGNGENARTQLFYFEYIVKADAPVGQSYFDIVVGDAFDASFATLPVSGSRCSFRVAETVTNLSCRLRVTSSVETAINQEFTLTYTFNTTNIASGSVAIRFDPELFAVSEVTQGDFLADKMTDINTSLSGAVYLSFLGAQYGSGTQLLTLRMKTLQNVSQLSPITVTVTDLYDLQLNPITCDGCTTAVKVTYDPTVDENAPFVFLQQDYDAENQTVTVQVCLEEDAHLGAGDFVLQFDTERLAYKSAVKGYSPTFFNINSKNVDEGLLKFSVISMTDMTAAVTMLTATFDVLTPCESTATKLQISGSGLANHLTVPIVLNFTGCTVETAGHTAVVDAAVAPTCLETGLTEGSHCAVCEKVLVAQETVAALGHDEIPHEAKAPTCTEIGWEAYNTCSRCDYTTYQEIPANGHTFQKGVCVICGADQDPGKTWDISAAADGSLMAKLYLNADGTYDLQLTGSGPMKNGSGQTSTPWYSYREKITGLRLPDGLTTIGDYAFNSFTALTEITLPESLESLGYMAFYQCTKLQQINFNAVTMNDLTEGNHVFSFCGQETDGITLRIGADVEKIPAYLFLPDTRSSYKPKLTAVEFEAGGNCLEIGRMAFYQCRDISRLQLPESLQSIGYYAFGYCSGLESLTLPEGLMTIENYAFYACDALQEVELPGSLTQIGYCAFTGCSGLKKVTVLEGVTIIGDHAFYNCSGLQQLQLPASLTTIDSAAFAGCTGLRKLRLPETVATIGVSAFNGCTGLNELQLPKDLVTIGSNAFVGCAGLTELHLPEGLQTIDYAAFSGCTGLTELTLPKSLRSIGGSAFNNCRGLTKINFNAANLADLADSNWVFAYAGQNGDGITVSVGSSVTKIPAYLFYPYSSSGYAPKIVAVEFAESSACQSIGQYAFYGCTDLRSLTLPESLQTIGNYAFCNCRSLIKINFNAVELADLKSGNAAFSYAGQSGDGITLTVGSSVTQIPAYLFYPLYSNSSYTPKVTAVAFEEGSSCRRIGTYAFYQSEQLTKICIPESVEEIGVNAFAYCANLVIALEADTLPATLGNNWKGSSPYILGVDRVILESDASYALLKNGSAVLTRYYGSEETYSIPDTVENAPVVGIHEKAFYGNTQLKAVQLPESLQTIGASAFYGCTGLKEATLPDGVQSIGADAFSGCTALESLTLPESLQTIGSSAFYGCTGLTEPTLPENLQTIGNYAFYNCTSLTKINFNAANLADLGDSNWVFAYAGQNGDGITISVGSSVTKIPAYLFYPYGNSDYTPKIVAVEFAEESNCQSIGSYAFYNCNGLTELTLPESLQTIGSSAFYGGTGLTELTLPKSLRSIGGSAFNNCSGLTKINFNAANLADLGDSNWVFAYAGQNGDGITISVGSSVTKIPAYLFYPPYENSIYTPKIVAVEFAENSVCQSIGNCAFYGCAGLTKLDLPEDLQTIGSSAFRNCTGLKSLTLPEGMQTVGKSAFSGCTALSEIRLNAVQMTDLRYNNGVFDNAGKAGDGITLTVGKQVTRIPAYLCYPGTGSDSTPKITRVVFEEGSACQSIGSTAFTHNRSLLEMQIPATVNRIEDTAFGYCKNLILTFESDTLPETLGNNWAIDVTYYLGAPRVVTVGDARYTVVGEAYAILSRYNGKGETFRVEDQVEGVPVTVIDQKVFYGNTKLTAVTLPESLQHIGDDAFYGCTGLSRLQLPESLLAIGNSAFYGCTGLESLTLPENLQTIGNYAFYNCTSLTKINYNAISLADLSEYNYVFSYAGQGGDGITVTVGSSVTRIPAYLFYPPYGNSTYTPKLVAVEFAEGSNCQSIGSYAFYNCNGLTELTLPESLQTIGSSAFYGCTGQEYLNLPESLQTIEDYAFYGCTGLTELTLPESLQTIGSYAFCNCTSLTKINYNAVNLADLSSYNEVFSYAGQSGDGITVTVGSSVTKIPAYLFNPYYNSDYAPKIVAVEFAEGSNCQSIGSYAFSYCQTLKTLILPESLQTIGDYAFYNCTGFSQLTLSEGLTTVGSYAFYNCTSLTKINYNAISLADLSEYNYVFSYAGQGGDGIAVTVGSSVTRIPAYLFYPPYGESAYTPKLVAVEFAEGSNCQSIGSYAFYGCTGLNSLHLPEGLQTIDYWAFGGCTGLNSLHLPEGLQTIGYSAFSGCTGLETLTLPESLQTIGNNAFYNCTSLTKINYNAISLAELSSSNHIFSYAGQNGDGITVTVGSSVTKIPAYLFYPYSSSGYAPKIVAVEFAESSDCQSIGNRAFYGCTGLTELTLPESLQTIGGSAFYGCTDLRKVMVLSSAVAEQLISADAAGYLTQYAQTVLLPGDTTINSYLQNKYANREQIIRDGVSYWLLDQNTHSWLETQTLIERIPCQRDGLIRYTCEYCNVYKDVTVERHTIVGHEAKAPDCVHIGWHAYETCENCDYSTYAEIPALGHDPVAHEAKAQTCLAIGWEAYETCSRCDYSTYQELSALGHDEIPHAAQAVTCLAIGWNAYVTCSRCDYSTYQEIPALGHGIIKHDALAPTCLEIGWDAYETCSRCDYSTYAELSALGHRVLQRTTSGPIPYEEKNDATWPFSREGDIFASSNHDHGTISKYVITAKRDHTLTVECKVSSENNYDFLWIYHNDSLIAGVAGESDWQAYTREVKTGDTVKISYMKDGSQSKGQDTGWFRLKASWLEQLPGEEAEPTCVEPVVCAFCEIKLKDALGHDPVYSHTQQPTCLEVGYHVYACTRCDYIEKQEIAALGHDLVSHEAKAPTCTEIGWDAYEACSRCSYTTYKKLPATGHSFVETFCTGCGMKQTPMQSWDVSAAGDGSLMAYLYQNLVDGGYELELEGSGTMKDYSYNAPWYSTGYCYSINRVSLPEGLTYIGACAFQYCSDLRQIRIPDSVERIDNSAFNYAKNLVVIFEGDDASLAPSYGWYGCGYYFDPQKVILDADATYVIDKDGNAVLAKYVGNGNEFVAREEIDGIPVTQIGRYAFYQKTNLKTYWISEEINTIGDYAFGECNGTALLLESTQLPTSLGSGWNGNCDDYPGAQLFTENNFLFVKDQNDRVNLITYQGTESEITIPAQPGGYSITRIPNYAFYENRMLTRVVLPEGIVSVGDSAFASCSRLQEVVLPTSLEKIGSSAFQYCGALQSIRLPEGLQTIGTGAFWGCSSLTEISIPDSVTRLESTTFTDCSRLESVTLPKNLNYMGYMQFYGCPNLKELELPEGVHAVGSNSFYRCGNLKVVYIRSSQLAAQLTGSGDAHEMIQNATTVVVPAGTGTDYLKATYPYCETRMRDRVSVDVYSSCAHEWQTERVSEYAQCVSDGYEIHTCSLCGVWTDDLTPKHAMETTVFAPTCTEDGYTLHTCADCGATERTDPVNKLGHQRQYGAVLCDRCGQIACLMAVKNGDSLFGCGSWQEAMNEAWRGNTLVLYGDITGDVTLYTTKYLDLCGHSITGTLTVAEGVTLRCMDSATDDFTGSYGTIGAVTGTFEMDVTCGDKRYIALTDENGVSFHRLQLQLHTVSLRTANAGLYYKAAMACDDTLRSAITRHGVALSLKDMPGADFKEKDLYTWLSGAPTGDFTSGSVVNIFRSDLTAEENAARGEMKIYANAYLQLADGRVVMSDVTAGDTVGSYGFDGIAWSLRDVLETLNRDIDQPAYAEQRQQLLAFCESWRETLSGWQLDNLTQ